MKPTLIAAALVLSLGAIGACAKEGADRDVRAGTTSITSQEEQVPAGTNAALGAPAQPGSQGTQGAAGNYTSSTGTQQSRSETTESPRTATPTPAPREAAPRVNTPRFVPPPRPSDTGDPPPPPLRNQ